MHFAKGLVFILLFFVADISVAQEIIGDKPKFTPASWAKGIHFMPSAGVNTSIFDSKVNEEDTGWGGVVRMDVGYYFSNDFAMEIGSSISLNRVNGYLMWDNQFNLGIRTRITFLKNTDKGGAPYFRAFLGRGPLVLVFERSTPSEYAAIGATRLQLEGPSYGTGIGFMQLTATNTVWFMELALSVHQFETLEVIKQSEVAPVVISRQSISSRSTFSTLHLMFGMVAF